MNTSDRSAPEPGPKTGGALPSTPESPGPAWQPRRPGRNRKPASNIKQKHRAPRKAVFLNRPPDVFVHVPIGHDGPDPGSKSPYDNPPRPPGGKPLDECLVAAFPSALFQLDASFPGRLYTAVLLQHPDISLQDGLLDSGNFPSSQWVVYGTARAEVPRPTAHRPLGTPRHGRIELVAEMKRLRREGRSYRGNRQEPGGQSRLGDPLATSQEVPVAPYRTIKTGLPRPSRAILKPGKGYSTMRGCDSDRGLRVGYTVDPGAAVWMILTRIISAPVSVFIEKR